MAAKKSNLRGALVRGAAKKAARDSEIRARRPKAPEPVVPLSPAQKAAQQSLDVANLLDRVTQLEADRDDHETRLGNIEATLESEGLEVNGEGGDAVRRSAAIVAHNVGLGLLQDPTIDGE